MKAWHLLIGIFVIFAVLCSPALAISKSDLIASYGEGSGNVVKPSFSSQYGPWSVFINPWSVKPTPTPTPTSIPTPDIPQKEIVPDCICGSCDSYTIPAASSTKITEGKEFLIIRSNPEGAFVYLDGKFRGLSPLLLTGLSAGSHQLKLTKSGYADYTTNVTILAGRSCSGNVRPYPGCENWLPCITLKEANQIK